MRSPNGRTELSTPQMSETLNLPSESFFWFAQRNFENLEQLEVGDLLLLVWHILQGHGGGPIVQASAPAGYHN